MQRANILKCQREPFGGWLEPFVCGQQKKNKEKAGGSLQKMEGRQPQLCSEPQKRCQLSFWLYNFSLAYLGESLIKNEGWECSLKNLPGWKPSTRAKGGCRKSLLPVWVTYQTQRAETPSPSQKKPRDLLLTRGFFLVFSGKQWGENSLWVTAEGRKKIKIQPQDFLLKKL